jgi:hypothetical protein
MSFIVEPVPALPPEPCSGRPVIYYVLRSVHDLDVSGVVIPAAMVEAMAFWWQIVKAVIAPRVAAVIVAPLSPGGRGR